MPARGKISTYEQAFRLIGAPWPMKQKFEAIISNLEVNGHTEKSICYAIWKENEKLCKAYVLHRKYFWRTFEECIMKWSWPAGDPRWKKYWDKKKELRRARECQAKIKEDKKDKVFTKRCNSDAIGFIYFIQGVNGGPIKIGYSTNIETRLRELQTGYPDVLRLLLAFRGNMKHEKALHRQLNTYRLNGEWFSPAPFVLEKIEKLRKINTDLETWKPPKNRWNDYC